MKTLTDQEKIDLLINTAYAETKLAQCNYDRQKTASKRATRLWLRVAELMLGRKPTDEERNRLFQ